MKSLAEAKESLIDENIEQATKNETISEDDALELKRESLLSYVKELEGESTLKSSSSGRQKPLPAYLKPTVASSRSAYPFLTDVRDVRLRGFGDRIPSPQKDLLPDPQLVKKIENLGRLELDGYELYEYQQPGVFEPMRSSGAWVRMNWFSKVMHKRW